MVLFCMMAILAGCSGGGKDGSVPVPGPGGGGVSDAAPYDIPQIVQPRPANATGPLGLTVRSVTSSTLTLEWKAPDNVASLKLYISPEPAKGEVLEADLDVSATSYTIRGLAASAHIFARLVAGNAGGSVSDIVHALTTGGPRAKLDTPLREVHGYAPNILQIVLKNGDGVSWQDKGSWKVTRSDGKGMRIVNVYRNSVPVSADRYFQTSYDPNLYMDNDDPAGVVTEIDHRIYLVLDAPVGSCEWLSIEGPNGLKFRLPFSDRYLETPVIQVNQVGYNPRATKRWAYVSGWMGDGGPLSLASFPAEASVIKETSDPLAIREDAITGLKISGRSAMDPDAGTEVRDIDLAVLPPSEDTYYRVRIKGVGVSWRTSVSERAVFQAFYVVMRGLFFNRWGGDLRPDLTYWSRPQDHLNSTYTANTLSYANYKFCNWDNIGGVWEDCPPMTDANRRTLTHGYHDAGDFDQRPMHTVVPQLLMRAYEIDPGLYRDGQLNIPESGNGIPDLLDEAMWGVSAWEQLSEPNGGVRQGVESHSHPLYYHANFDPLPYWTYNVEPNVSARAAGLFAQASRLILPYDAARASVLRSRSISSYDYAKNNGASEYFLMYPAGELFKLTGEAAYGRDFERYWRNNARDPWNVPPYAFGHLQQSDYIPNDPSWPVAPQGFMPDYVLGYYKSEGPFTRFSELYGTADPVWKNVTIPERIDYFLTRDANDAYDSIVNSSHAHRNPRPDGYKLDWGNGSQVSRYLDTIIARLSAGGISGAERQRYFDALSLAADFTLGCNPNGFVYITGLGSRHPVEPLHIDSLIFIKEGKGAMPGIPVYGPITDTPDIEIVTYYASTKNSFYPAFTEHPPALRYADTRPFVNANEFDVWQIMAPHAELFSILLGNGTMP